MPADSTTSSRARAHVRSELDAGHPSRVLELVPVGGSVCSVRWRGGVPLRRVVHFLAAMPIAAHNAIAPSAMPTMAPAESLPPPTLLAPMILLELMLPAAFPALSLLLLLLLLLLFDSGVAAILNEVDPGDDNVACVVVVVVDADVDVGASGPRVLFFSNGGCGVSGASPSLEPPSSPPLSAASPPVMMPVHVPHMALHKPARPVRTQVCSIRRQTRWFAHKCACMRRWI